MASSDRSGRGDDTGPGPLLLPSSSRRHDESDAVDTATRAGNTTCALALPEELWTLILAQLPLPDLARARCVCTSWNGAWYSRGLRRLVHRRSLQVPWGVYFPLLHGAAGAGAGDALVGFDTASGRQQRLPPVAFGARPGPGARTGHGHHRVTGSRGLLCGCDYFWRRDSTARPGDGEGEGEGEGEDGREAEVQERAGVDQEALVVIANPLTGERRELPPLRVALVAAVWFRARTLDPDADNADADDDDDTSSGAGQAATSCSSSAAELEFGVCLAGWTEEELESAAGQSSARVFLSWTPGGGAWHTVGVPAGQSLCNFVLRRRRLYFVFRHEVTHVEAMAEYDPERAQWRPDRLVTPPRGFPWVDRVVECRGALFGVAAHSDQGLHLLRLLQQHQPDATAAVAAGNDRNVMDATAGVSSAAGTGTDPHQHQHQDRTRYEWEVVRRLPDMDCDAHPLGCPWVAVRDAIVTHSGCLCVMLEHREPARCRVLVYHNVLSDRDEVTWHTLPAGAYEVDTTVAVFGAYEPSFRVLH